MLTLFMGWLGSDKNQTNKKHLIRVVKPPVSLHGILIATEDGLTEFTNNICLHKTQFLAELQ